MSTTEEGISETLDILEETSDIVEETLDNIEHVQENLNSRSGLITMGIIGLVVGATVSYFVTKKVLTTKYEAITKQEIEEAKEFYKRLNKKGGFENPKEALAELYKDNDPREIVMSKATNALQNYQGVTNEEESSEELEEAPEELEEEPEEEEEEEQSVSVYMESAADENFDLEEEMKLRSPNHPYVISQEEFLQGELNFDQTSITYYDGDDTLADERDQEIPYPDPIVGQSNLERFGDGSGDDRVVYIRNEKLSTDFEVLKSDGKFAHEVLGLQHSAESSRDRQRRTRPGKFRDEDE